MLKRFIDRIRDALFFEKGGFAPQSLPGYCGRVLPSPIGATAIFREKHDGTGYDRENSAKEPTMLERVRSEESRVGKECVSPCSTRWTTQHQKRPIKYYSEYTTNSRTKSIIHLEHI